MLATRVDSAAKLDLLSLFNLGRKYFATKAGRIVLTPDKFWEFSADSSLEDF